MTPNSVKTCVRKISKKELDRVGKFLSDLTHEVSSEDEIDANMNILNDWRSLHSYAMHIIYMNIKRKTEKMGLKHAIVAQRLKRAPSIIGKLQRFKKMKLSRMQDIGGVRIIVKKISDVYRIRDEIMNKFPHKIYKEDNYINKPKPDGYRSLHIIFETQNLDNCEHNGLKVELQIRTQQQHQWATAVEVIDLNKKSSLKSGVGDRDTKEFLCMCSSLLAVQENTPIDEKYHGKPEKELYRELKKMNERLNFLNFLTGLTTAVFHQEKRKKIKNERFYLIILRMDERLLNILPFAQQSMAEAEYVKHEREILRDKKNWDVVLISMNDIKHLKRAYPNYYLDLEKFIEIFGKMLAQAE